MSQLLLLGLRPASAAVKRMFTRNVDSARLPHRAQLVGLALASLAGCWLWYGCTKTGISFDLGINLRLHGASNRLLHATERLTTDPVDA